MAGPKRVHRIIFQPSILSCEGLEPVTLSVKMPFFEDMKQEDEKAVGFWEGKWNIYGWLLPNPGKPVGE